MTSRRNRMPGPSIHQGHRMQSHRPSAARAPTKLAIVAVVWLLFGAMFLLQFKAHMPVWNKVFGVPVMAEPFADLAQIPAANEARQHGLDPYAKNPYDIEQRRFSYPRLWLYFFSALRITPARTIVAGLTMAGCFLLAVSWLILRQREVWTSAFLGLASFSSAAAFAVERGNTDILILCLVLLAVALETRGGLWLLTTAALLKVYPIFAVLASATWARRTRLVLLALLIGVAGIIAQRGDFGRGDNSNEVPHGYGVKEIDVAMELAPPPMRLAFAAHRQVFRILWQLVLLTIAVSGAAAGAAWARRQRAPISHYGEYAFVLCGSIFIGTFLVSTSYDYRLIFLLPLLPLFMDQARNASQRRMRILGGAGVALLLIGVNRGVAALLPSSLPTSLLKVAGHLDLWALLWLVCFFLGVIAVTREHLKAGNRKVGRNAPLHDTLMKESA